MLQHQTLLIPKNHVNISFLFYCSLDNLHEYIVVVFLVNFMYFIKCFPFCFLFFLFKGSPLFAIRQKIVSSETTEGTIFLLGPLDFEKQAMYHLTILANVSQ